jgi:hypothetical protein
MTMRKLTVRLHSPQTPSKKTTGKSASFGVLAASFVSGARVIIASAGYETGS